MHPLVVLNAVYGISLEFRDFDTLALFFVNMDLPCLFKLATQLTFRGVRGSVRV